MRSEVITVEPQIVQFGREATQTLKIVNNSPQTLHNFFFCLYNTEKFSFIPDTFSLGPHEHKLVSVNLKIKSARTQAKEFAYLKSTQINKRITLVINQFQSPDVRSRSQQQGFEDMNTLSSREYRQVQTQAIEKIIQEKEAYIAMLQKQKGSVNRSINFRTEESGEKMSQHRQEIDEIQMKLALMDNEKQTLLKENIILQSKFEEYKRICQSDLQNYERVNHELREKIQQNAKLQQEVQYLENQGSQFLAKIGQKEEKLRELQLLKRQGNEESKRENEWKLNLMEQRLQEQKNNYHQSLACTEQRIKELQKRLQAGEDFKDKNQLFQKELKKKEEEIRSLMAAVQTERGTLKEYEVQKKKWIKLEMSNQSITEKANQLASRVKELDKVNHNLREEIFVYKSKLSDQDASSDKMNQYLEIALESCRSENQALKRTKCQLQKSLDDIMSMNRHSHENNKALGDQLTKYKQEAKILIEIKDSLERKNEEIRQEHHLSMMKLKAENIELLERLSMGETSKREDIIKRLEEELLALRRELAESNVDRNTMINKNQELLVDNTRLTEKVKRYKKEAKKQLRNINDTAINQLHKEHEDKKQMAQRIIELEEVIINNSCDKVRGDKQNGLRRQRTSSRVIGIKDQRRELKQSHASSTDLHSELGQLREINNFVNNQEERFNQLFQLHTEHQNQQKLDSRPIFRVIKFFKQIQNKLDQSKGIKSEGLINTQKQMEYLKGRLRELEVVKDDKENLSSINLSKTREHCSQLLQFVREQMKSQYKKLNDALKLSEQRFDLLKKKIYEQYRTRIIDTLNKKDKHTVAQIQTILERFIDGMSNLSHKEAVLHKEIKLKQTARKHNTELKEKVNQLNFLLQSKKGYCSRDPVKLLYNQTELQWQESLKRQAELLTLTAESQRLKEELDLVQSQLADSRQDCRSLERELQQKSGEVLKLKRYQIQIQGNYEGQIQKQYQIIQDNKKRIMQMTKTRKETVKTNNKEKQYHNLKESLDKQKEVIKQLRDKEKVFEQLLEETHRVEEKDKRRVFEESRVTDSLRDLKDNNRELRTQNEKLKEKVTKLEEDLQKKTLYMKNLKGNQEENRMRVQRKEEAQNDSLKEEIKNLSKDLQKSKEEGEKSKKKKERELAELKSEIDRLRNQNLITEKSLESIIRALMDTIRKLYGRLRRVVKKAKGKEVSDQHKVFESSQGIHVNALKIDQVFEEVLAQLQQND